MRLVIPWPSFVTCSGYASTVEGERGRESEKRGGRKEETDVTASPRREGWFSTTETTPRSPFSSLEIHSSIPSFHRFST